MMGLRLSPFDLANVRGAGTRDEPLRTSVWDAIGSYATFFEGPFEFNYLERKGVK